MKAHEVFGNGGKGSYLARRALGCYRVRACLNGS